MVFYLLGEARTSEAPYLASFVRLLLFPFFNHYRMPPTLPRWFWLFTPGWLLPLAALAQFQVGERTCESVVSNNRYRVRLCLKDTGSSFSPPQTLSGSVGSAATSCGSTNAHNFTTLLMLAGLMALEISNLFGLLGRPDADDSTPMARWRLVPLASGVYLARVPGTDQTLRLLQ